MTFQLTNVPQSGNTLAADQPPILNNTKYFYTALGKDHQVVVNDSVNATPGLGTLGEGRHNQVNFVTDSGANPTIETADNVNAMLWSHNEELFFQNTTGGPYQITTSQSAGTAQPLFGTNTAYPLGGLATTKGGWTFLPGGLILQYGIITPTHQPGTTTVTFPIPFPSAVFSVQVTALVTNSASNDDQTAAVTNGSVGVNSFLASTSSSANVKKFYWIAIGN